jgi:TRAP-type C4-dicarboxylate transport system substrate-binding protein
MPEAESWTGLKTGVCDILHWAPSEDYQRLNWGLVNIPFMGFPSMEAGGEILVKLIDTFPEMKAEFEGAEIIGLRTMPPTQLHMVRKAVKYPGHLKGVKILATAAVAEFVESIGGVPVYTGIGEMYTSLDSGLVEAVHNHWPVVAVFGCLPLFQYHTNFGDGGISLLSMGAVANPDSWRKLPPDIQKMIKDAYYEYCLIGGYAMDYNEIAKYTAQAIEEGHQITNLGPEEIKVWQDEAMPLHDVWIAEMEDYGPAREIYDEAKRLIAEYTQ